MTDQQRSALGLWSTVQRIAPIVNGLLLVAFVAWLLFFDGSRPAIEHVETRTETQDFHTKLEINRAGLIALVGIAGLAFATMAIGLWRGRRESRSLRAWLFLIFLVCGWLAVWQGRHDLYWFGHTLRVSQEVSDATLLANALDQNWPSGDGDYPELGVVLGYPKENPVSFILAGEPISVGKLKVVAIDKSKDGKTLRFQLANPNHDTWLVRSRDESRLSEFVSGFDTRYTATRSRRLSSEWWLVRYDK